MSALTVNADRRLTGGQSRDIPSQVGAAPFQGSLLSWNASGLAGPLVAGQPFAGVSEKQIIARDAATVGGLSPGIRARTGEFLMTVVLAGVTRADCVARRRVYASSDNDLSLTAEAGNTFVGEVFDLANQIGGLTNGVVIYARTCDQQPYGAATAGGSATLADAAATLTTAQLDLVLYMPNTAAHTDAAGGGVVHRPHHHRGQDHGRSVRRDAPGQRGREHQRRKHVRDGDRAVVGGDAALGWHAVGRDREGVSTAVLRVRRGL